MNCRSTSSMRFTCTGLALVAVLGLTVQTVSAQCAVCPAPTVAYRPVTTVAYQPVVAQPVVAQPVVAYKPYTGWYPGKLLDQWRLRRYGVTNTAAPAYTAAYAPATVTTNYVTSYAPLASTTAARPIMQTSFFAPTVQTVARPVLLRPVVVARPVVAACCPTGVSQAAYAAPAPACAACATGTSVPSYSAPSYPSGGASVGPPTPQPQLSPSEPTPSSSRYRSQRPTSPSPAQGSGARDNGSNHNDAQKPDVYPSPEPESDSSTYLEAPKLFHPKGDRTASRPSVEVWNAVYHKPVATSAVSQSHETPSSRTQAEIDAEGWYAVSRDR